MLATKLVWLLFDAATAGVLYRIAANTGRNPVPVLLLYLWSPLLVVEIAWSAHLETLGLFPLSLALLWAARAPAAAGAALAAAALVKVAPAALLPPLARRAGVRAVAGFAVVAVVLYLPYLTAGDALFAGLRTYGEHWWFMKGPFALVESFAPDPLTARRVIGTVVIGVVAYVTLRRFDLERATLWVLGTGMIVTPTLHPWYVLWMLPVAALRASVPWIALTGLAFLGYFGRDAFQETGTWPQPAAVRAALWLPFLVLLALELRHSHSEEEAEVAGEKEEDER